MPLQAHLLRMIEDARLGLDAFDAAGEGIAAAMRAGTMDPDGACQLLRLANDSLKRQLDALVDALAANDAGDHAGRGGEDALSRNCTR